MRRIELSPTSLAEPRVLMPHVLFLSVGLQWLGMRAAILHWEMNVEKLICLIEGHQVIYDASHCEHRHREYVASIW
jgi:hypothetical protein